MENLKFCETELLYFGKGNTPSLHLHTHPFYQLEVCLSGLLHCRNAGKNFVLAPGEIWLIPPETLHDFPQGNSSYEYLSLKFLCDQTVAEYYGTYTFLRYNLEHILQIINHESHFSPFAGEGKEILESYLNGIMLHLFRQKGKSPGGSSFIASCRELVCKYGYQINVSTLAEHFHYTRSQLQYRFAKEYGAKTNIKKFIEDILIHQAEKHLRYSAMNLSAVARTMNFPSIYIFSRFFKRKTGISPLKMREKLHSSIL